MFIVFVLAIMMSKQALMMSKIIVLDIISVAFNIVSVCLCISCHVCLLYASLYHKVFV